MARTFTCLPRDPYYTLGSSHQWTVEESPLPEEILLLVCPDHDLDPKNEGPWQDGRTMLLVEELEKAGGWRESVPRE